MCWCGAAGDGEAGPPWAEVLVLSAQGRPAIAGSALPSGYACQEAAGPEDTATACRVLLAGLARDTEIFEPLSELAPLHPRNNTFPGEVFLHLAADALD